MFRRFDAVIEYPLPTAEVAKEVVRTRLANVRLGRIEWEQIAEAAHDLSHAEITLAAERAAKDVHPCEAGCRNNRRLGCRSARAASPIQTLGSRCLNATSRTS